MSDRDVHGRFAGLLTEGDALPAQLVEPERQPDPQRDLHQAPERRPAHGPGPRGHLPRRGVRRAGLARRLPGSTSSRSPTPTTPASSPPPDTRPRATGTAPAATLASTTTRSSRSRTSTPPPTPTWASKSLPTAQQWEKAARGTTGTIWPWGDQPSAAKCNARETGIGTTTSVSRYHSGVSPYGVYDLVGNVWEWTSTPSTTGRYELKGSAFTSPAFRGKPAAFNDANDFMRDDDTGFRCAALSI